MATKNKTAETPVDVSQFVHTYVDKAEKKADTLQLIELMSAWTGCEPKMWGPTIIGFGKYHYKYPSGREGDAPLIGFSPRKPEFTLYVNVPGHDDEKLLSHLGKYTMGKSCIYFKRLTDLNLDTLEQLSKATIKYVCEKYECAER